MHGKGSCLCGQSSYTFDAEPTLYGLCHCIHCRKTTSSLNSTAIFLPASSMKYDPSSPIKEVTVPHNEARFPITTTFCGNCGSAMSKVADTDAFKGSEIVLLGCLDEPKGWLEENKPQAEMWTKHRPDWRASVEGAAQNVGLP